MTNPDRQEAISQFIERTEPSRFETLFNEAKMLRLRSPELADADRILVDFISMTSIELAVFRQEMVNERHDGKPFREHLDLFLSSCLDIVGECDHYLDQKEPRDEKSEMREFVQQVNHDASLVRFAIMLLLTDLTA